jgi:hypothetical protein
MIGKKEAVFKIADTGEQFEIRKFRCKATVVIPYQKGDVFAIAETVCAALNAMEDGRTVRSKRPAQQEKHKITPHVHKWGYFHSANEHRCIECGEVQ